MTGWAPPLPPERLEAMGWEWNGEAWVPPPALPSQRDRAVAPPKGAVEVRPNYVYCCVWADGTTKVWGNRKPWERFRERVAKIKWPAPTSDKQDLRPRFFRGSIEWWQYFDTTEDDGE